MGRALLTEFMMQAPYQPATNYWRAVETEEAIKYDLPTGLGLDMGCGDGHLMEIILGHIDKRELVGIDIDARETALARGRNIYREIVTAPADRLPFPDSQFDFVFSNSVLEHIHNVDGALTEAARVLRSCGRFLFTVPGPDFHRCLKGPRFRGDRELYLRDTDARCFHLRYWDVNQWAKHLHKAGFALVHQHEYFTMAQVQRWESIARNTSGLLYSLLGRKKQPIEIQRLVGIRNPRLRLPRFLASLSAGIVGFGTRPKGVLCGCLFLEARKRE